MASEDPIAIKVTEDLKGSPYACTSLIKLSGGTANFAYRAALVTALPDGTKTVLIKHAEPYLASASSFKLDVSRSYYEQTMLKALHTFKAANQLNIHVTTPHLYEYSSITNTQIMTDYPSSLELKHYMTTHTIPTTQVTKLGIALGSWLKQFHSWASAPEQNELKQSMRKNEQMTHLKFMVNYGRLIPTIELFPPILEECKEMFTAIEDKYKREIGEGDLIHGDFWSGNILLPDGPLPRETEPLKLFVIDWELSHVGSRAFDLGQCFAELYLLTHFRSIEAGARLISDFLTGYGELDSEMAFRVALHFGVHLIVWPPRVPGWGEGQVMEKCVEMGRDVCGHAWREDKEWFRGGVLDRLFYSD